MARTPLRTFELRTEDLRFRARLAVRLLPIGARYTGTGKHVRLNPHVEFYDLHSADDGDNGPLGHRLTTMSLPRCKPSTNQATG
ncbi:hypothetical protein [Nocardia sp. NRRL S-836]|uniref:hypothetical protein n=1 Tax=Nocardia sp. NRRL S-836 TaxID=1519492 RepID=UPI0006AF6F08|nr:hypothetical protein [Nocardia sp. NRRL S-836]KOV84772.1 hypothetical protein ADL03_16030 [Nocardia sp. NRRL S-836]